MLGKSSSWYIHGDDPIPHYSSCLHCLKHAQVLRCFQTANIEDARVMALLLPRTNGADLVNDKEQLNEFDLVLSHLV